MVGNAHTTHGPMHWCGRRLSVRAAAGGCNKLKVLDTQTCN